MKTLGREKHVDYKPQLAQKCWYTSFLLKTSETYSFSDFKVVVIVAHSLDQTRQCRFSTIFFVWRLTPFKLPFQRSASEME